MAQMTTIVNAAIILSKETLFNMGVPSRSIDGFRAGSDFVNGVARVGGIIANYSANDKLSSYRVGSSLVSNWNQALYSPPCITAAKRKRGSAQPQKEGWLRHQKNVAKPPKPTQPGWFSFSFSIGKPPRPRDQRMLRDILLIARPPLLLRLRATAFALRRGDARREWPLR